MQYFVRSVYTSSVEHDNLVVAGMNIPEEDGQHEDEYDAACKAYSERLGEIREDLPKSIRKLLADPVWTGQSLLRYANDHFYIDPSEELTFLLEAEGFMFVVRYSVDSAPTVEAPDDEDKQYFDTKDRLEILEEEWDVEGQQVVHRILLSNGYIVVFRPKAFHWWKTKVKTHG